MSASMGSPHAPVLTLVRHGRTRANVEQVWHGSTDTPLDEVGRAQAVRIASYFRDELQPVEAIYTSPLARAGETARCIGEALAASWSVEPDLREFCVGEWEGRPYRELLGEVGLLDRIQSDPRWNGHGGDSAAAVAERTAAALRRIASAHRGRVVVVGHGAAWTLTLGWLLEGVHGCFRRLMDNGALTELTLDPKPRLLRFNHSPPAEP